MVPGELASSESVFLPMINVNSSMSKSDDSNDSDFREDDDVGEVVVALLLESLLTRSGSLPSWSLVWSSSFTILMTAIGEE